MHEAVPQMETGNKPVQGLNRRIASSFRPYLEQVVVVGLLILVTAGLGVVNPLLIQVVFDSTLGVDQLGTPTASG